MARNRDRRDERDEESGDGQPHSEGRSPGSGGGLSGTDETHQRGQAEPEPSEPAVPISTRLGQGAVLLIAVLFAVFAVDNSHPVHFSWVFGGSQVERDAAGVVESGGVPLIVLLLVSFVVGATLGGWWIWQAGKARRHRREDAEHR